MDDERKAELTQLAKDIHAGHVFTDRHVQRPEDINLVFMPLVMMDRKQVEGLARRVGKHGMIYEYISQAGPRGINGMPNFFSFKVATSKETKFVFEKVKEIEKAMETV